MIRDLNYLNQWDCFVEKDFDYFKDMGTYMEDFEMQLSLRFYHDGMDYICEVIDNNDQDVTEPARLPAKTTATLTAKVLAEINSLIGEVIKTHEC